MEIISNTRDFHLDRETAVALGKFDGVHLGHRRLLREILQQKEHGLAACVFTFDPSPAVFFGGADSGELTTREEKRLLFQRMGVDILIEFPLTARTAGILPEDFVRGILTGQMRARFLAAGEDLSFGAGGKGDAALLERMAGACGFRTKIIEKVKADGQVVSSSLVRRRVEAGEMEEAKKLLGAPYSVTGKVVHGRRLGHSLGMPTINLLPPEGKLMPPCGVYYSTARLCGREYRAISNVGYKPTVTAEHVLGLETYLYGFDGDAYGEEAEVALHAFRRPERRFAGTEELKAQLREDIRAGAAWNGEAL